MDRKLTGIRLEQHLREQVDQVRGPVSFNRWVSAILTSHVTDYGGNGKLDREAYLAAAEAGLPLVGRLVLDGIHDGLVLSDVERLVRYWNRGAVRMFGYTEEELIGRHVIDVLQSDFTRRQDQLHVDRVLRDGFWREVGTWYHKDGTAVRAEVVSGPMIDADGHLFGFVSTWREVIGDT